MNQLLSCASLLLLPAIATAQRTFDQEEMKAKFAEMQAEAWFENGGWITDFSAAKARSAETGKPIFAYFTRTYAY